MRKFALVILDDLDKVIDRYNLDLVTQPQGLGFTLNVSFLSGDIRDVITKVSQAKNRIKFTINQYQRSYSKANSLALWVQKYSKPEYIMALEYDDGNIVRYCEGRVVSLGKTEIDTFRNLPQEFEFLQTTPFFVKRENTIVIQTSATGKSYPFKYPYAYGRYELVNNDIDNVYLLDIPLVVTIYGAIDNPTLSLVDEDNEPYKTVAFNETLHENERIIINSAQNKIWKIDANGVKTDYSPEVDPSYNTFLLAKGGHSKLTINSQLASTGFRLVGGWREYRL